MGGTQRLTSSNVQCLTTNDFLTIDKKRRFEELRVWKDARILVKNVYTLTEPLKDWGFKDQIRRAAVSVMNNIAEGSEAGSDANFTKFLNIAKGSCGEVRSMLYLLDDIFQVEHDKITILLDDAERISSNIYNLILYLNKDKQ